jgi:hypothetical protein
MKNYDTYSELIYLVIDGEASDAERTAFYSALANSTELQNEFQTAMKMNRAAESFPKKTAVPLNVSNKLFSKAGLTYFPVESVTPPLAAAAGTAIVSNSIAGKAISSILSKISFAVSGLILGAGMMYFMNVNSEVLSGNTISQASNIRQIEFAQSESKIPVMSSVLEDKSPLRRIQKFEEIAYNNTNSQDLEYIDNVEPDSIYEPDIQIHKSRISKNLKVVEFARSNNISDFDIQNRGDYSNNSLDFKDLGLTIELRNSSYWNTVNENVLPSEISKFHNMDIFVYKEILQNLLLGVGMRQETFYAKYYTVENGRDFIYEQQPNLTNYELAVRYLPYSIGFFKPLIQFNLGGGKYGYTYRGAIGSEINLIENFSILLTIDYATFNFFHKDIKNNSGKVGINYGINYKF